MYIVYIYIYVCVCCFSPLVARPHLESTTVIEIQQVYIESCEMILSWLNIIIYLIWQYGFRPNESGHETVQQELALPVWAPASTKTGSLAVLLSEGKAQTSQTTKTPPVQKVLSSFSLRALSSGCWIWSLEKLFHKRKNENTKRIN